MNSLDIVPLLAIRGVTAVMLFRSGEVSTYTKEGLATSHPNTPALGRGLMQAARDAHGGTKRLAVNGDHGRMTFQFLGSGEIVGVQASLELEVPLLHMELDALSGGDSVDGTSRKPNSNATGPDSMARVTPIATFTAATPRGTDGAARLIAATYTGAPAAPGAAALEIDAYSTSSALAPEPANEPAGESPRDPTPQQAWGPKHPSEALQQLLAQTSTRTLRAGPAPALPNAGRVQKPTPPRLRQNAQTPRALIAHTDEHLPPNGVSPAAVTAASEVSGATTAATNTAVAHAPTPLEARLHAPIEASAANEETETSHAMIGDALTRVASMSTRFFGKRIVTNYFRAAKPASLAGYTITDALEFEVTDGFASPSELLELGVWLRAVVKRAMLVVYDFDHHTRTALGADAHLLLPAESNRH
jgi:hypothetical protein